MPTPRAVRLTDLKTAKKAKEAAAAPAAAAAPEDTGPKLDPQGRAYATGKRKNAIARVWIKQGGGKIIINGKPVEQYFARPVLQMIVRQPFMLAERDGQFNVEVTVLGGGLSGQAGAVKHGISKALTIYEPNLRAVLKKAGFLTRDARVVERKMYGHYKSRRRFQYSKR